MIQATLHIDSEKKWAAIRAVLEAMDVAYDTQKPIKEFSDKEQVLLERAEADVVAGRLHKFKSHREILGRYGLSVIREVEYTETYKETLLGPIFAF